MKKILLSTLMLLLISQVGYAQTYYSPTHYHGIFSGQPANAKAASMGYSMITLDGVANSIYNPATISPDSVRLDFQFNYSKGHSFYPTSHYPFVGLSYKPLNRLTVSGTLFSYRMKDPVWTTQIGAKDFDPNGLYTQSMYSLGAAYQIIHGLHLGGSANFLHEKGIKGETTNRDFILSAGVIYDRQMDLIRNEDIQNQKIRVAGNFFNVLGNSVTVQKYEDRKNYRNLPVYLRLGGAYSLSVPIEASFTDGKKLFETMPRQLDISINLHMQNHLKTSEAIHDNYKYGTAVGFGTEVQFLKTFSFRVGYYSEKRRTDDVEGTSGTSVKKAGLTWGYGANIPVQRLTENRIPFDVEVNVVTANLMDELNPQISHPSVFSDDQFLFAVGINIKMR